MNVIPLGVSLPGEVDHFCDLSAGLRLCYRTMGPVGGEPLLLIAGLGLQLTSWPRTMLDGLLHRGYHLITLDNRDIGRSSRLSTPPPALWRQALRRPRADAYDLDDMAQDVVGLLDHLGLERVHVVGMSMGGMIAQQLAARHGGRVRSLTSIFSTTGARQVGQPRLATMLRLMAPPARTQAQFVERYHGMVRHIAGKGFSVNDDEVRGYAARAWERGDGATAHEGVARQISAIFKSGDRTRHLRRITVPTLVIHGDRDPLVQPSGGAATAAAIAHARHATIAGMGHYLADGAVPRIVSLIDELARSTRGEPAGPAYQEQQG